MGKYIIEIEDTRPFYNIPEDSRLFRVKGFKSLVFDDDGLEMLEPYMPIDETAAEQRGAEKAWELAKKISTMPDEAKKEVWGTDKYNTINLGYSYAEAAAKYEAWEKQKKEGEIKVGDEVSNCTGTGVVVEVSADCLRIMYSNGASYLYLMSNKEFKKTGRHFPEVAELLAKIGESNE